MAFAPTVAQWFEEKDPEKEKEVLGAETPGRWQGRGWYVIMDSPLSWEH